MFGVAGGRYRLYDGRMQDSKTNYKELCQKEQKLEMTVKNKVIMCHFGEDWDDSKTY